MGPLVTNEIISPETNFLFALLIGVAFGFILEASGFSSSRKLAGIFYGYDAVVLKVFFTAGVTAMVGLLFASLFGMVNLDLLYVNPTYWHSNIAGGVIMGIGFIMGGFCPGTSFCGASIGKIDAMVFVGGLFIGVFAWAELYPLFEDFYKMGFEESFPTLNESIGVSKGVMALLMVAMALGVFWFVEIIEKKFKQPEY